MSWGGGGRGSWLREEEGWGNTPTVATGLQGGGRVVPVSFPPRPALFYLDGRRGAQPGLGVLLEPSLDGSYSL